MRPRARRPQLHDQFSVRSRHITGMANDRYSADCSNRPDRVSSHSGLCRNADHVVQADCDAAIVLVDDLIE